MRDTSSWWITLHLVLLSIKALVLEPPAVTACRCSSLGLGDLRCFSKNWTNTQTSGEAWSSEDNYWLFPKHIHDIWNLLVWSHYHLNQYKCCHLFTLMLFKSCMTSISFFHKSKREIVYQSWIFPSMKVTCGYQKTLIKKLVFLTWYFCLVFQYTYQNILKSRLWLKCLKYKKKICQWGEKYI